MRHLYTALFLEDDIKDLRTASRVLIGAGYGNLTVSEDLGKAMSYLENVVAGEKSCPDIMVLDLALGSDSEFEALAAR